MSNRILDATSVRVVRAVAERHGPPSAADIYRRTEVRTMQTKRASARASTRTALLAGAVVALTALTAQPAAAASSKGCVNGGFSLVGQNRTVSGPTDAAIPAADLGPRFLVRGTYVEFTVVADSFAVENWTLTGAANELDITGGRRTVVFAAKTPDHRGLTLSGPITVDIDKEDLVISRAGTGLSMKIQAKDCAQGGVYQAEPERADGTPTVFTHRLADDVFYFDNPFFRQRIGQVLNGVTVAARVNFANDVSPKFVGRDSPQVATRLNDCVNAFGTHCGGVSRWSVASGGRMGQVMGEDAVEVAPAATNCVQDCQAQNRVRGRFVVLGFPFPVPLASRLTPRFPAGL